MRDEIISFVKQMKAGDHVIFFHSSREDKRYVLFTYIQAGLEKGQAAAYVTSQETPDQVRKAMQEYGVDVKRHEASGALRVIDYRGWYIIGGGFDPEKTMDLWRGLVRETRKKGFKGMRVTGDMTCFFDHEIVQDLMEYEANFSKSVGAEIMAICAYDQRLFAEQSVKADSPEVMLSLLTSHSTAIITGHPEGLVKTI
ncbi:MAG: MEDS domain-containing protein [Promethearchaeati archaeon SRVP18_Atabeyarchaeia-1]